MQQTQIVTEPLAKIGAGCEDASVFAFCDTAEAAIRSGNIDTISNDALRRAFAGIVRLYAAKAELHEASEELAPFDSATVTATEAVVAACAMVRAVDLNLLDLAMWFSRRRPA
jgi:hypothetical protein